MGVFVVTGSASGIGRAAAQRLRRDGEHVIGVDLHGADVIADLGTTDGRAAMLTAVADATDRVDGVIASAGVSRLTGDGARIIAVNYFGVVATLLGLRPFLFRASRSRAVALISTAAALLPGDSASVDLCLIGDETAAVAASDASTAYATSKLALARWIRREAVTPDWAGKGILLNGVAPGVVRTPMTAERIATAAGRAALAAASPIAVRDYAAADEVAELLGFMVRMTAGYMVGQIVYFDGGADALRRPTLV